MGAVRHRRIHMESLYLWGGRRAGALEPEEVVYQEGPCHKNSWTGREKAIISITIATINRPHFTLDAGSILPLAANRDDILHPIKKSVNTYYSHSVSLKGFSCLRIASPCDIKYELSAEVAYRRCHLAASSSFMGCLLQTVCDPRYLVICTHGCRRGSEKLARSVIVLHILNQYSFFYLHFYNFFTDIVYTVIFSYTRINTTHYAS